MPPLRSTTFDRAELSARVWATTIGFAFIPIGGGIARILGIGGILLIPCALAIGFSAGFLVYKLSSGIANGSGRAVLAIVQPSGKSTPYDPQFSQGLALEAADDVGGAMAWFEDEIVRRPGDARVRMVAADLHHRHGFPTRAEALYLEAREVTGDRDIELYCTQRLIDVRLGPLDDTRRAFPELRRIIDRFPDSREADGARCALQRLKAEAFAGGD